MSLFTSSYCREGFFILSLFTKEVSSSKLSARANKVLPLLAGREIRYLQIKALFFSSFTFCCLEINKPK